MPNRKQWKLALIREEGREEGREEALIEGRQKGLQLAVELQFGEEGANLVTALAKVNNLKRLQNIESALRSRASTEELSALLEE